MKKIVFIIFIILVLFTFQLISNEILLKVPVRVFDSGTFVKNLSIDDFNLNINGVKRNIRKVIPMTRDLGISDRARTFILNFNLTEYGQNIAKGINYFADTILTKKDNVILWTPIKIYRIKTNQEKLKTVSDIDTLVKKDSLTFKNFRKGAKDKLINILNKFFAGSGSSRETNYMSTSIIFFLNNYSREWVDFKKKYISPDMGKYYGLISMLTYKYPGEKYFINFQQREIMPSLKKYNEAKKAISNYLASVAGTSESSTSASISNAVQFIDRSMRLTDDFDPEILSSPFLGANISYNVIFFNSFRQTGGDSDDLSPDYEGILKDLAIETGGSSINTNDLKSGLSKIRKKKDFYYYVVFDFNGKKEEKKIEIRIPGKEYKISHIRKFHKEEIDNLIKLSMEKKIEITDLSITGHNLNFGIRDFKLDGKSEKIGIVKVKIELIDKDNNQVFSKENTLRAKSDSIKISLKLAPQKRGFFKLIVTAEDLKASRSSIKEKYIELK